MTYACTDCSRCGKCYPKQSSCSNCENEINLLDNCCHVCGKPITEAMRLEARDAYRTKKKIEHDGILKLAQEAKHRREQQEKQRPKYPWE